MFGRAEFDQSLWRMRKWNQKMKTFNVATSAALCNAIFAHGEHTDLCTYMIRLLRELLTRTVCDSCWQAKNIWKPLF